VSAASSRPMSCDEVYPIQYQLPRGAISPTVAVEGSMAPEAEMRISGNPSYWNENVSSICPVSMRNTGMGLPRARARARATQFEPGLLAHKPHAQGSRDETECLVHLKHQRGWRSGTELEPVGHATFGKDVESIQSELCSQAERLLEALYLHRHSG